MENVLEHSKTCDMYRQIFVPNKQNNVVTIPSKLYGREVEVIVLPAFRAGIATKQPRRHWAVAARQMHLADDDKLLIPTELENENNALQDVINEMFCQ